jgi:hypothetical protein
MAATSEPPRLRESPRLLRGHHHTYRPTNLFVLASSSARRASQISMAAMCASDVTGTGRLLDRREGGVCRSVPPWNALPDSCGARPCDFAEAGRLKACGQEIALAAFLRAATKARACHSPITTGPGGATMAGPNEKLARSNKSRTAVLATNRQSSPSRPNCDCGDGCPPQRRHPQRAGQPLTLGLGTLSSMVNFLRNLWQVRHGFLG